MSYKIISKFIKDVSFEIPDVQAFVMLEKEISNFKKVLNTYTSEINRMIEDNNIKFISF